MAQPVFDDEKLTKKFYMGLQEGVYLVSAVGGMTPFDRDFESEVVSADKRDAQWAEIKEARVNQASCMVFESRSAYQEWCKGWKQRDGGQGWYREDG